MDNNVNMASRYEHEIPEGYEARIEGNKVIIELKESEDERIRKGLIEHLKELKEQSVEGSHLKRPEHYDAWIAWLEKQGSQNLANSAKTCKDEQKPAWSEEDEIKCIVICDWLCSNSSSKFRGFRSFELSDWLKSLKERCTWKPSDVQMECLLCEVNAWTKGCIKRGILESLYNDLKKLKG